MLCFHPVRQTLRAQTELVTPGKAPILRGVGTASTLTNGPVGVNGSAAARPGKMTFPELVKSDQTKIDSDFLKMKPLEKGAQQLKRWRKTERALANILQNEILNLE